MKIVGMKISGALIGLLLVAPASAGTNPNAKGSGAVVDSTMVWNGITRYYEVYLPPHLPANPPMVFMLHGTSHEVPPANPSTDMWGWQSVSNKHGFILVKPASTYNPQSGQWNWDAYTMDAAFQSPPDDSGFLRNLIVTLTGRYNVNPNQVYVAGFSSGAQMAHRVGVEISDLVAAIAGGVDDHRFLVPARRSGRSPFRSGAARWIARCRHATTASRSTQAASFTWPPWTSLSITGLGRMPAPCSRIVIHCAKTDCPTRSRPATTPRDVRATPKSNIFGRRTSGTFGPRSRTPLAGSSLRRTRSNRVRRRARLPRRFPQLRRQAVATQMVELDLNSRDAPRAKEL